MLTPQHGFLSAKSVESKVRDVSSNNCKQAHMLSIFHTSLFSPTILRLGSHEIKAPPDQHQALLPRGQGHISRDCPAMFTCYEKYSYIASSGAESARIEDGERD